MRLRGQVGTRRPEFRFKGGERKTWPTPQEATKVPLTKVIRWETLGEEHLNQV